MTAPRPRLRRSLTASAVVAAMLALAACGSTGGPGESSGAGTSSSAAGSDGAAGEPTTGGTLEVGFAEDIANYDPHQRPQLTARTISRQIADTLTDQDPETGEIVPFLAESWEISDDATEFTFTLREDATFSDGTPVDAAAVKANFDRIIEIGALSYVGAGLLRNYTGSEVLEPYVVKVSFSEPNAQFLQATSVASLSILAPATLELSPEEVAAGNVIGSGPYTLESYDANAGITLKVREDYAWGSPLYENDGRGYFDEIHFSFITEQVTLAGAVASGQIDYAYNLVAASLPTVEAANAQLVEVSMPAISIPIVPLVYREVWSDERTRQALNAATNREAIAQTVFEGRNKPATGVLTTSNPGYVDLSDKLAYDPERAVELLEEAGWTEVGSDGIRSKADGTRLSAEIQYASNGTNDLFPQLLQQQWAQVGIELVLTPVAAATLSEYTIHNYPFDLTTWSQTRADADVLRTVYSSFYENQSFLFGHPDAEIDALLGTLQSTVEQADRLEISRQVQELLLDRAYTVPLYDLVQYSAGVESLGGIGTDIEGKPLFVDFYQES